MRKFFTLLALATGAVSMACAASFSGLLLDAGCSDQQKNAQACIANDNTIAFLLSVNGKVYQLDDTGNTKAAEAMKNRADRSTDPNNATTAAAVTAKVEGTLEGQTINVRTIDIQ